MGPLPGTFDVRGPPSQWGPELTLSVQGDLGELDNAHINGNPQHRDIKNVNVLHKRTPSNGTPYVATTGAHYIIRAAVTGFVPLRHGVEILNDMAFIVDVTWSDGRTHMVKRTFSDFYNFHFYLLDEWGAKMDDNGTIQLTYFLPGKCPLLILINIRDGPFFHADF